MIHAAESIQGAANKTIIHTIVARRDNLAKHFRNHPKKLSELRAQSCLSRSSLVLGVLGRRLPLLSEFFLLLPKRKLLVLRTMLLEVLLHLDHGGLCFGVLAFATWSALLYAAIGGGFGLGGSSLGGGGGGGRSHCLSCSKELNGKKESKLVSGAVKMMVGRW